MHTTATTESEHDMNITTNQSWTVNTDNPGPSDGLVGVDDRIARDVLSGIITGRAMGTREVRVTTDAGRFVARRIVLPGTITNQWTVTLEPTVEDVDDDQDDDDAPAGPACPNCSGRGFVSYGAGESFSTSPCTACHSSGVATVEEPAPATQPAGGYSTVTMGGGFAGDEGRPITANTTDRQVQARSLTRLDLEWLARIPVGGWSMTAKPFVDYMNDTRTEGEKAAEWTAAQLGAFSCVIAYEGEFGISMGVVRGRIPAGSRAAVRGEDTFDVSPFPGAWERVPLSRIVCVRASSTL